MQTPPFDSATFSPFIFRVLRVFRGRQPLNSKLQTKYSNLVTALLRWFAANARDLPWRRTRDPYAIWVSEIMLQQTQVKTVIPYWRRWMRELPTIGSLARARSEKTHKLWEGLGYYTRVRNLQHAARLIVTRHGGKFPDRYDAVLELPGIGRYTAGAICSIAFNQPVPVLDGNVIRVLTRVFGIPTNPREKKTNARLWQLAGELVHPASRILHPASRSRSRTSTKDEDEFACSHLNQSLMELGALVCTPRNPGCEACPVRTLCVACRSGRQGELPNPGRRAPVSKRRFVAFVVERNGKYLVRQRPAGVVNAHLWEFPNIEAGARAPGLSLPKNSRPFCTIKHSITRYRITLEAHRAKLPEGRVAQVPDFPSKGGTRMAHTSDVASRWLKLSELDALAFTSAHRKILEHLNTRSSHGVQTKSPIRTR